MSITGTETLSKTKTRIAVVGIGGVGGYYGGLLSKYAETHPDIEVIFIARGANLNAIREHGLRVIVGEKSFVTHPAMATDNAEEVGEVDYVILATKSYDLDDTARQISPMVGIHTIVLPLLNGIDITARLRDLLPDHEIWYGCAYIVARLNEPGVIESSGNVHFLHFGYEQTISDELGFIERLFLESGIEVTRKNDPVKAMWRKFFFISATASLTTYLNTGFRDLAEDEDKRAMFVGMMQELLSVAHAEGVDLKESLISDMLRYAGSLPAGTTASMNSDYLAGKRIELETLTGVVLNLASKHGIEVPLYSMIYGKLKSSI